MSTINAQARLARIQCFLGWSLDALDTISTEGLNHTDFAQLRAIKARLQVTQRQIKDTIESMEERARDQAPVK